MQRSIESANFDSTRSEAPATFSGAWKLEKVIKSQSKKIQLKRRDKLKAKDWNLEKLWILGYFWRIASEFPLKTGNLGQTKKLA